MFCHIKVVIFLFYAKEYMTKVLLEF